MRDWNIFTQRSLERTDILRATVLSSYSIDVANKKLPCPDSAEHTVIIYAGGGGFVANLQMVQEGFLKKFVKNQNLTIFETHCRNAPEFKCPT